MYILPNATEFNNACASVDRTIATKCEVISGGVTTTMVGDGINGEIISMEWDNIVCSNDGLQIGTTCMDEFKMTYRPVSTTMSLMGKEIHPYVGLEFGTPATVTYVPLGVFYVTDSSTEDDGYTVNITAYDGMQKFMGKFNPLTIGVAFPINAWDLLTAIATYFGVTLTYDDIVHALLSSDDYYLYTSDNYRLVVSDAIDKNKHASLPEAYEGTYRDYIGWIVGLVGAYAHMGRNGDLVVSQYKDHGFEVGRNVQHMGGAKINYGGAVTYTSIVSGTEENPIYPTYYGGNAITYTNPFITQSELDHLCEGLLKVDGITVTPCDVAWRSNPCVDAGDIVSVVDKDGNNLSVYVMERVVRITGGLAEELHCYGETETAHTLNKSPLVSSFAQKISEVMKTASDYINNTKGTFEWIDNGDGTNGGFTIYQNDDEMAWLRCTAGGLGISDDGGMTYANAITPNGIVATEIKTGEMSADRIRGGTLQLGGYNNVSGIAQLYDGNGVLKINLDKDGIIAQDRRQVSGTYYTFKTEMQMAEITFRQDQNPLFKLMPTYASGSTTGHGALGAYRSFYVVPTGGGSVACRYGANDPNVEDGQDFHATWYFGTGNMYISGGLTVTGTKSRSVITKDYGERLLYAYETPSPMFGDMGEGEIAEDGYAYIIIDPTFAQTIQSDAYHVFITSYSDDDVKIAKRTPTYFVCKGTEGTKFSWMLIAKQKGYEVNRLEEIENVSFNTPQEDFGGISE